MASLCQLPVAKNHNFGQFLTFFGAAVPTLLPIRAKFGELQQTRGLRFRAKFRLDRFILSFCAGEKTQFLPFFALFFGIRHLVVSPIVNNLRKLSMGTQLQTFPYPTASKSFLCSNAFMAKSGAQTFKSVTNKQTNRQTNRQTRNRKHRRAAAKPAAYAPNAVNTREQGKDGGKQGGEAER